MIGLAFLDNRRRFFETLKFQKTVYSVKGLKKTESFLMWGLQPKTQKFFHTLCYSPCDDTPTAAIAAVTTGVVLYRRGRVAQCGVWKQKRIFFANL